MNPKLQLFDALALMVAEKLPEIKTFRLFNNQFEKEGVEKAFAFPAVFVEFLSTEYTSQSESRQIGETMVRFYLGFHSLKTEDRRVFEVAHDLNFWVQNFSVENLTTPFDRKREVQDVDHESVIVWKMEYSTLVIDNTANRRNKQTLLEFVPDLEIKTEPEGYFLKPS
jgi:hypothetical protein